MKLKNLTGGIVLILSTIVLFFCTNEKEEYVRETAQYSVRVENPADEASIRFSEYFKSGKLIPLETTDNSLLSKIDKVVLYKQLIFVKDQMNEAGVLCYDENGKYLYRVGQKGEGPENFINLTDFSVDQERGKVYIYDSYTRKVYVFDEKGKFEKSIYLGYPGTAFEYKDNKFYLSQNNQSDGYAYDLCITDMNGKILNQSFTGDPARINAIPKFRINGEALYYYANMHGDTIYRLTDAPSVEFKIDYGKHTISPDDLRTYLNRQTVAKREGWKILRDKDCIAGINDFYPVGNYLIFGYTYQSLGHYTIYDMATDSCRHAVYLYDDVGYVSYLSGLVGSTSYQIMVAIDYDDIESGINALENGFYEEKQLITSDKIPDAVAVLKELRNRLQEDCNPILVIYDLK